ncbi:hypothetical protein HOG98_04560 [bacterium]|jgi:hypothetical protein|nr:hypothetical protein [bacterium]
MDTKDLSAKVEKIVQSNLDKPSTIDLGTLIMSDYRSGLKLELSSFEDYLLKQTNTRLISLFSKILEFYLPSFTSVSFEDRDEEFEFVRKTESVLRKEDNTFLLEFLKRVFLKTNDWAHPACEVIMNTMVNYSGLSDVKGLEAMFALIGKTVADLPFELLVTYEEPKDKLFPIDILYKFIKISMVFFGTKTTVSILNAYSKRSNEKYFDLEILWLAKHSMFRELYPLSVGAFVKQMIAVCDVDVKGLSLDDESVGYYLNS